jgi:hypothetical protein
MYNTWDVDLKDSVKELAEAKISKGKFKVFGCYGF